MSPEREWVGFLKKISSSPKQQAKVFFKKIVSFIKVQM
jgi:hypothetical protein